MTHTAARAAPQSRFLACSPEPLGRDRYAVGRGRCARYVEENIGNPPAEWSLFDGVVAKGGPVDAGVVHRQSRRQMQSVDQFVRELAAEGSLIDAARS